MSLSHKSRMNKTFSASYAIVYNVTMTQYVMGYTSSHPTLLCFLYVHLYPTYDVDQSYRQSSSYTGYCPVTPVVWYN